MQPIQGGGHIGVGMDVEVLALVEAAFLGGAQAEQITGGGAAEHPLEPMGDAMAVFVGRTMEGLRGIDFFTRF